VPDRIGDYRIHKYLTAGGMADLYLASSPKHDFQLVVKRIQPRYLEHTRVVKMFIDEGRIAQALDHPNIVKIVDVGQEGGNYYIAMEHIAGKDLLAIARRGVEVGSFLPRTLAVSILVQALRGLQHAHEKRDEESKSLRVVHCDISPGNIVVSWGGTAKLVDFGISRATIQLRVEDHSVAGKYNYMAPEQIKGEPVDARTDLFSLGVILYELTCGKRLFRGRPEQIMRLVIEDPITPPSQIRPDFPLSLERIVMRALERDPARRWQSARELRDELRGWLAAEGSGHSKREIAEYLRSIFGAEKVHESQEFGAEAGDDELILEKGLPRTASGLHVLPLRVDLEDVEPTPPLGVAVPPVEPKPAPPRGPREEVKPPANSPAPSAIPGIEKREPSSLRTSVVPLLMGGLAALAVVLYFLLRR
jgi:serine/threonine-protein kinase